MKRSLLVAVVPLLVSLGATTTPLGAQTVRPAVVEYQERARGKFELVNETLFPLTVVIEPRGFRVEESGELVDEPLDTTRIKVKLSAMSFRIPPRQSYTVFYDATADRFPAWFLIASTLSGAKTQTGINVRVELPHVVYMLQKTPLRRTEVAIRAFDFDSATKRARIQLENTGTALGRVLSSEISIDGKHTVPGGAFPLFPHSRRWHEIPWDGDGSPDTIVLRFANFAIEERKPQQPGH